MHEAAEHEDNCFVTLTYAPENLPWGGCLVPDHFTKFMKRLRFHTGKKLRYFMCGEYGEKLDRPHYHALIFGLWPEDVSPWKKSPSGHQLYTSELIETIWGHGFAPVGSVDYESAGYVARYCTKKIKTSQLSPAEKLTHYERVTTDGAIYYLPPEYARMSRRPGIGKKYFEKFKSDIYPHDEVIVRGKVMKPPRYYDKLLKNELPDVFDQVLAQRKERAWENWDETQPKRLDAKRICTESRFKQLKRVYEQ